MATTTEVIGEGDWGGGGRAVTIDSAERSSNAGESTRNKKRAVCVGVVGSWAVAREAKLPPAVIVAMVVVAVLDVVGCGGRDRRETRKVVAVVSKHGLVVVSNQVLMYLR